MFNFYKWAKGFSGKVIARMPFYAVARGHTPGVYSTWPQCEAQVKGFKGARHKKFDTEQEARDFIAVLQGIHIPLPPRSSSKFYSKPYSTATTAATSSSYRNNKPSPSVSAAAPRPPAKRKASGSEPEDLDDEINKAMDKIESKLRSATNGIDKIIEKFGGRSVKDDNNKIMKKSAGPSGKCAILIEPPTAGSKGAWMMDSEGFVRVWTDGSCLMNGRKGARAGLGVWWGPDNPSNTSAPASRRNTNNSGEIQAATLALRIGIKNGFRKIAVHTDSKFLINAATKWMPGWRAKGWKRANGAPVLNIDDFKDLDDVWDDIEVKWVYVPGHSGHVGNEAADALARAGAMMQDDDGDISETFTDFDTSQSCDDTF